ncbi:MAG: HEAT repeat domain-containing protein [Planctomycetota bacterium]|jgi:HEAT repeat protein
MSAHNNKIPEKMAGELIAKIKTGSDEVRTESWLSASEIGAAAVKPLATIMAQHELEVTRAAKRGLWKIVRHVGRPGADDEKNAAIAELISLLDDEQPVPVRQQVLQMLSEIGGDESVDPIAALLSNTKLREDARMSLERIPGRKSIAALKTALKNAHEDFKLNLAQSLRQRGVKVRGLECVKLLPTKQTNVKPIKAQ